MMRLTQLPRLLVFLTVCVLKLNAQIAGTFTVPNDFPNMAAAVNTLNLLGVAGPVTVYIAAGHTETVPVGGLKLINPPGNTTTTILFTKLGVGSNPLLVAYSGGTATSNSTLRDGIWMLGECSNVTINEIDLLDPNTTAPSTMEYGYGFYRGYTSGCRNNTIRNCVITLGGSLAFGSCGIELSRNHYNYNATVVAPTTTLNSNSYNTFYNNVIQECDYGIYILGSGNTSLNLIDYGNDIGGLSAATGNTIVSYGMFQGQAIFAEHQFQLNASFNTITNYNGTFPMSANGIQGIYALSPDAAINSNTLSLTATGGSNRPIVGIRQLGYGGLTGTVTINNNIFPSISYTSTSGASSHSIVSAGKNNVLYVSNNSLGDFTSNTGTVSLIHVTEGFTCNINNNSISGATVSSNGHIKGITGSTEFQTIENNSLGNFLAPCTATNAYTSIYGISSANRIWTLLVSNNTISNMYGSNLYGMSLTSTVSVASFSITSNNLTSYSMAPTNTVGAVVTGIFLGLSSSSNSTMTINSNTVSSLRGAGYGASSQGGSVRGVIASGGTLALVFQNKIYDLFSSGASGIDGMILPVPQTQIYNNLIGELQVLGGSVSALEINSGNHKVYFNTFCLTNTATPSGNYGTNLISCINSGVLELKNNILVNTSVATGTGITAIMIVNNLLPASNGNLFYLGSPDPSRRISWGVPSSSVLSGFQTTYNSDAQSIIENPPFASTTGSNSNFLNINPSIPTQIESGAIAISTITTDFINTVRSATPDIGAWEGNYLLADATPPTIISSSFVNNSCNPSGRTFTLNASDPSGIASGTVAPRLYYKKNFGLYTSVQGSLSAGTATNGIWTFNLAYSTIPGDIIHYFFAVQDQSSLSNYTLSPSLGANASDINNVIIPPSPAYNFTISTNPVISVSNGSICPGESYTLNPSGAATYTFSGGGPVVNPTVTTSYSITGTSAQGCVSSGTTVALISVLSSPTITVNSGSICSGQNFSFSPSGADNYTFTGGSTIVSPSTTSVYTITGSSSALGCTSLPVTSTVTVHTTPVVTVNSGTVCAGLTFSLVPSGADFYTISGGSLTVSPSASTVYLVTGSSTAGCLSSNTATAFVNVAPLPTISVNSGSICSGKSFTILATGADNYIYSGGTATVSPLTNTVYFVSGTSSFGCLSTNTAVSTVSVETSPVISVNSGSICAGQIFTIIPSAALLTYTYSGGSALVSPTNNTFYTVVGTNSLGCVSNSATSNVTVYANPTIAVNSGSICSGNSFTIVPSGADLYTISGGTTIVSPTSNTVYLVSGINLAGCMSSNTVMASLTVAPLPTISVSNATICSGTNYTLSPSGASSYSFSSGSAIVSPATNTNYIITGASIEGCTASNTVTANIVVNASPTITVNSGSICSGETFTIIPSDLFLTYTYPSGSAIVSPSVSTNYSITGVNGFNCVSNNVIAHVTVNVSPTISVNSGSICMGNVFTLTPMGADNYTISGGSSTVSPTANTVYTVTGISLAGCPATNTVTSALTVAPLPTVSASNGTLCTGNSYTIIPSGAASYNFSSGTAIVSPSTNTLYTVTGTSSVGCTSFNTATVSITVHASPSITVNSGSICAGSIFTIIPSDPNLSYAISGGTTLVSPSASTFFTISGTNTLGCVSNTAISSLTVFSNPTVSVNSGSICAGSVFTITPTGAANYSYTGGSPTISPLSNSSYSVLGESAEGCVSQIAAISSITVIALPNVSVNNGTICANSVFTLSPSGAISYSYSSGSQTVAPANTSTYLISGENTEGCIATIISTITVKNLPLVTANASSANVCSGQPLTLSGGGAQVYAWSGGVTDNVAFYPTTSSIYTVTGTATNNCVKSETVQINVLNSPTVFVTSSADTLCSGDLLTLTATGADTYLWNTGDITSTIAIIATQPTYSVMGTNTNGCKHSTSVSLFVNECTGISVIKNIRNIRIYPNPNKGIFHIESNKQYSNMNLQIVNAMGQTVLNLQYINDSTEIDLSGEAKGIYFLRIYEDLKLIRTEKLIVTQ